MPKFKLEKTERVTALVSTLYEIEAESVIEAVKKINSKEAEDKITYTGLLWETVDSSEDADSVRIYENNNVVFKSEDL